MNTENKNNDESSVQDSKTVSTELNNKIKTTESNNEITEKKEEAINEPSSVVKEKKNIIKKIRFEDEKTKNDTISKANLTKENNIDTQHTTEEKKKIKRDAIQEAESKIIRDLEDFTRERENYERSFKVIEQESMDFINHPGEYEEFYRFINEFEKYKNLCDSYMENQNTIHEAMQISFENQQTIQTLQNQIKKATETIESNEFQEEAQKEELRKLKQEILNLSTTMSRGVNLNVNQERIVNELLRTKEQTSKDLEEQIQEIQDVRNEIISISENIRKCDLQKQEIEQEIYFIKDKNIQKKLEIEIETKTREKIDRDLRELRSTLSTKIQEVHNKSEVIKRTDEENESLKESIENQNVEYEKINKEKEQLILRVQKLQQEFEEQTNDTNKVVLENEKLQKELKDREDEITRNKNEIKKIRSVHDEFKKKIQNLEEQKEEAENKRREMKDKLVEIENDRNKEQKFIDHSKRILENLTRENFILDNNIDKIASRTQKYTQYISICEQIQHHIKMQKQRYISEATQITSDIKSKKAEIQTISNDIVKIQEECVKEVKDIKQKELKIYEYQKKVMNVERKLKRQQNLYDALQTDRNLHSKKLIEVQSEIGEMRQRVKIMNYQISGYKENILCKEDLLKTEKADYEKLRKDTEQISSEIKNLKLQNDIAQTYIRNQMTEEAKLNKFVKEAELEKSRQENTLNVLVRERDNLSSQWIKQNSDLQKAYNNLKTIQSSILREETKYSERMKEIRVLYEEIWSMKQQRISLKAKISNIDLMKNAIYRLETQLIEEQTHEKALEDELKKPINVHRWRQLEGTDPQALEMIKLHQTLQQKLMEKSKTERKKDEKIREIEKNYLQLKMILSKKIGSEAMEQISEYQQILKDKKSNLKHIETELEMYQTQSKEYKYIITELNERINSIKNEYINNAIKNKKMTSIKV
jgi:chromosome segregation ATPase